MQPIALGPGVNGFFLETCSDIIAGTGLDTCECGKTRQRGKPHGWRAPGSVCIGRVSGTVEADAEDLSHVMPDHFRVVVG